MSRVVTSERMAAEEVAPWLQPRDDLLKERPEEHGEFSCDEGPFHSYRRTVEVEPGGGDSDDEVVVTQTIEFVLAIPVWGWLFAPAAKRALRRPPDPAREGRVPWWSPPDRLDERMARVLGLLCGVAVVTGYLGVLLSQTIAFAADEFGASDSQQGWALASARLGVLLALVIVAVADRRGRRRMLVLAVLAGCLATAVTALAPGLVLYATAQTASRAFSTAAAVLLGIIAVEEMPRNSRAYAVSVLSMSGALGAGLVVTTLFVADLGTSSWRILFLYSLPLLLVAHRLLRALPESKRYLLAEETELDDIASHTPAARRSHRRRLTLIASSALLGQIFFAPASQFFNDFLRDERNFSALKITFFQVLTNLPGGIGIVVGGKLADVRGRRVVGAVGLVGGVGATVVMYNVFGFPMWAWSVVGAVLGAATVPALGVYGPELFPTNMRGRSNGVITVFAVVGAGIGLVAAGYLSDHLDGFGPTMAILALGPALVALLVITLYPETAHLELEEINPEDTALHLDDEPT